MLGGLQPFNNEVTDAMSRTSTATWKRIRKQRREHDQKHGLTNCPSCGIWLEWDRGLQPNSAEVDHVIPHSAGGLDHIDNTRTICRLCNQRSGGKLGAKTTNRRVQKVEYRTSLEW